MSIFDYKRKNAYLDAFNRAKKKAYFSEHGDGNLFFPFNVGKGLASGKLYDAPALTTSDYINMTNWRYIAIDKGSSYGWYSAPNEQSIVASSNKSVCMFRCYEKPAGAVYCRLTAPAGEEVYARGSNEVVTQV